MAWRIRYPIFAGVLLSALVGGRVCFADSTDDQQKALSAIADTADRICNIVSTSGSYQDVKVSGDVRAQLNGLFKQLADLGVAGAGNFDSGRYQGLLREDLTQALKDNSQCKYRVFDTLQKKMIKSQPDRGDTNSTDTVKLQSDVRANYQLLKDLLAAGRWRDADEETHRLMNWVAQRSNRSLTVDDYGKLPCQDLITIDHLWSQYSNGRFGFSVQLRAWVRAAGDPIAFRQLVGWTVPKYDDLYFDLRAPPGELPAWSIKNLGARIFSRFETCQGE